jgi:hypothetical protein
MSAFAASRHFAESPRGFDRARYCRLRSRCRCEPANAVSALAKPAVASCIMLVLSLVVMRRSVEFDDHTMFDAKKIHDIAADGNLTPEFQTVERPTSQGAPEHRFCFGHVASKAAGEAGLAIGNAAGHSIAGGWLLGKIVVAARALIRPGFAGPPSPASREKAHACATMQKQKPGREGRVSVCLKGAALTLDQYLATTGGGAQVK